MEGEECYSLIHVLVIGYKVNYSFGRESLCMDFISEMADVEGDLKKGIVRKV